MSLKKEKFDGAGDMQQPPENTKTVYQVTRIVVMRVKAYDEDEARDEAAQLDDHDWSNAGSGSTEVEDLGADYNGDIDN